MVDLVIHGGKVYLDGAFKRADLYIKEGRFEKIIQITDQNLDSDSVETSDASETFDAKGLLICPGIIDPHVHMALDLGRFVS
ncbi:MAG TPA: hypothetical protein DCS67_02220, partial [Clostridiales bacterium UBA8960]|nr:hypothetical protein [Clostridiales bacterium UBA8960]